MTTITLIDKALLLKKVALFEQLELDLLLTIADKLEDITAKPNEKIFHIDETTSFFLFKIWIFGPGLSTRCAPVIGK